MSPPISLKSLAIRDLRIFFVVRHTSCSEGSSHRGPATGVSIPTANTVMQSDCSQALFKRSFTFTS